MEAYSTLIQQPDGAQVEFSERLSRKVLASLKSLNESLTEVRASVAKIDSIAHARLTATTTSPGTTAIPLSFSSPAAASEKYPSTPSARSSTPLAATPPSAPPSVPPGTGAAATDGGPRQPSTTTASAPSAAPSTVLAPATSAVHPTGIDVSILERILLSPSFRGVGLDSEILQQVRDTLPANKLTIIEQHLKKPLSSPLSPPSSNVPGTAEVLSGGSKREGKLTLKLSPAAVVDRVQGPTRYYTFPRYTVSQSDPSSGDAPPDDGQGSIPFLRELVTEEAFQAVLAHDSAKGVGAGAAAGIRAGESSSPPAVIDAFTVTDRSPVPTVQDWQGGDVDWEIADDATLAEIESSTGKGKGGNKRRVEAFALRVVYEAGRTGFEEAKEIVAEPGDILAGRYKVNSFLGSAAFSSALSCTDLVNDEDVALKIIKNDKDFLDQSLDEIKLLRYLNAQGDPDANRVLKLKDYFYCREHLFIVTELLKDNLYDWQTYVAEHQPEPYFTLPRVQRIAKQVLQALAFVHSNGLIHCDLKPENILILSYSRCDIKVIDFGSSCYLTDKLSTYIQSRSYRAPEVVLGLPYGPKIDVWSLGCILTELLTGKVLFPNESVQTMLVRMQVCRSCIIHYVANWHSHHSSPLAVPP